MTPRDLGRKFAAWRRPARQRAFLGHCRARRPQPAAAPTRGLHVLVVGIYLSEQAHRASHLIRGFAATTHHQVEQVWTAIGDGPDADAGIPVRRLRVATPTPKFVLLNRIVRRLETSAYDYLLVTDDDIALCDGFLDAYLAWLQCCGFSIAQPARARHSFRDHRFVLQRHWFGARQTRFVEIGPLFSLDRAAMRVVLPFDESSPMGWGYDTVWPVLARRHGLRMGIVDATPVDHSYRAQAATYDRDHHRNVAERYLRRNPHLSRDEAMVVLRRFR